MLAATWHVAAIKLLHHRLFLTGPSHRDSGFAVLVRRRHHNASHCTFHETFACSAAQTLNDSPSRRTGHQIRCFLSAAAFAARAAAACCQRRTVSSLGTSLPAAIELGAEPAATLPAAAAHSRGPISSLDQPALEKSHAHSTAVGTRGPAAMTSKTPATALAISSCAPGA